MKKFVKLLFLIFTVSLVLSISACDLSEDDDENTCDTAVNNLWVLLEDDLDTNSGVDTCSLIYDFYYYFGFYWPASSQTDYYCEYNSSPYTLYIPNESRFKEDLKDWCAGVSYDDKWDQDAIDCNSGVDDLEDIPDCWDKK